MYSRFCKAWLAAFLLLVTVLALSFTVQQAFAQTPEPQHPVAVYLFYGEGCPHCAKAKPFLESLAEKYPELNFKSFEVYYDEVNQAFFVEMAEKYGLEQMYVPTMFIGEKYLVGYADEYQPNIEAEVLFCLQNGCVDPAEGLQVPGLSGIVVNTITPVATGPVSTITPPEVEVTQPPVETPEPVKEKFEIKLPIFGSVNLDSKSVTLSTVLIALLDGFNPCSLWVLTMLLALTLHTGSRKKIFVVGLVFITVTAAIYALFIAGLFSILKVASFMGWVRVVVALIAMFFAAVNIKDYFWYKEGISLTIADEKKPGIYQRMQAVMNASHSWWGLVGATIVLAAGVSLVEFSCTAGFPVLWTNLLTAQNVSLAVFFGLLLIYMLIYQFDELVIFFAAVTTLRASRLEERHGRILKLVSGVFMLTLSLVMLINPALMNNLVTTLLIFAIAVIASLLVLLVHRVILPELGVRIGSEFKK
ncbi:MAG TPA: glutaredoxin domain-containing protein [Anaerolineaceae bacterium]|nr:glutaredoxin domain-containing protein [Anaerolineaceae bacterium]